MAFEVALPLDSKRHTVCHITLLTTYQDNSYIMPPLPKTFTDNRHVVIPLAILDKKLEFHNNEKKDHALLQWGGYLLEKATWQRLEDHEDKVCFKQEGMIRIYE